MKSLAGFSIRDKCLFVEKTYDLLGMAGLVNFDEPEFGSSEGLINFDEPDLSSYGKMIHGSSKLRSLLTSLRRYIAILARYSYVWSRTGAVVT